MLIDTVIVGVPVVAVSVAIKPLTPELGAALVLLTAVAAGGAYFGGLNGVGSGQTLGGWLAGFAVRDAVHDQPIGVARGLLRWYVRFTLWFFLIPGLLNDLWPLWDRKHQTFADRVVGSVVVTTRPRRAACGRCAAGVDATDRFCRGCGLPLVAPSGWYDDPAAAGRWRYWDGRQWTVWTHAIDPAAAVSPPPPRAVADPPRGVGVGLLGFALGVGAAVGAGAALDAAGRPGGDVVLFIVTETLLWAGMIGSVLLVSRRRGTGSLARDFGWGFAARDWGIGTLGAIVGRSTTVIVTIPLYAAFHDAVRNPHVGLPVHELSPGLFAVYAIAACIGAPIVEELFFRGLIQSRLVYRWGAVRGIAVASVMFGAAHLIGWHGPGSLLAAAAIAGGGSVLGYLRHRTGRLGTSMVAHGLFNSAAVLLVAAGVGN